MKLKAYMTKNSRRVLRVTLVSDYLDNETLEKYRIILDCIPLSHEVCLSIFRTSPYPTINIDEYFNYLELLGIDPIKPTEGYYETFPVLLNILEEKYGIEYVDAED